MGKGWEATGSANEALPAHFSLQRIIPVANALDVNRDGLLGRQAGTLSPLTRFTSALQPVLQDVHAM
jgi:hypothetical protein